MEADAVLPMKQERPFYNSRIIDTHLKLIRKRYPSAAS